MGDLEGPIPGFGDAPLPGSGCKEESCGPAKNVCAETWTLLHFREKQHSDEIPLDIHNFRNAVLKAPCACVERHFYAAIDAYLHIRSISRWQDTASNQDELRDRLMIVADNFDSAGYNLVSYEQAVREIEFELL